MLTYLDALPVAYFYSAHPPVYTCEEADRFRPKLDGASLKNLFLQDEKKNYYLVVTECNRAVDLKELGRLMGAPKLHFASAPTLQSVLGVQPGAVTLLALVNDAAHCVRLVVDADIWMEARFLCHPLVNTATLVIERAELLRFLEAVKSEPLVLALPLRSKA